MFTRLEIKRLLHCKHYYSTPFFWMTEVCEFEWNDSLIKVSTKRSKIVTLDFRKHHDDCTVDMNRNIINCCEANASVFTWFLRMKTKKYCLHAFCTVYKKGQKSLTYLSLVWKWIYWRGFFPLDVALSNRAIIYKIYYWILLTNYSR